MNSLSFHEWYENSKQMYGFGRSFNTTNKPRYYEQQGRRMGYRNQPRGYWTQRQLIPQPLITNSILAPCFSQSRVHVSWHNKRKHQAFTRRTNRASKTSIFVRQTKWPFGRKTQGDRKRDSRPPLLFALALVWHSSAQVLLLKVTKYSETQKPFLLHTSRNFKYLKSWLNAMHDGFLSVLNAGK